MRGTVTLLACRTLCTIYMLNSCFLYQHVEEARPWLCRVALAVRTLLTC